MISRGLWEKAILGLALKTEVRALVWHGNNFETQWAGLEASTTRSFSEHARLVGGESLWSCQCAKLDHWWEL
ncbi:hypothetical protein HYDPIDRAFT_110427 [Hydnomerulius pinastri MD-312]|nr:hypothetical protein HYDPIDRAFT_110427 [Hydnomerulius pinastri MD-312]